MLTEEILEKAAEAMTITPEGGLMIAHKDFLEFGAELGIHVSLRAFRPDEKGNVKFEGIAIKVNDKRKQEFYAEITESYPDNVKQRSMQQTVCTKALSLCIDNHYPELMDTIHGMFIWTLSAIKMTQ